MLRMTTLDGLESATLKLEGSLLQPWVAELRSTSSALQSSMQRVVRLDLADLRFADADGVAALRDLIDSGFHVVACSPFVQSLLQESRS